MHTKNLRTFYEITRNLNLMWLSLSIISSLIIGCAGPVTSSTEQFASGRSNSITAGQLINTAQQLQNPENRTVYEKARALDLADVYTNSINNAPIGPIQLGGHIFDNMHDYLAANADLLQQIGDEYGTVGNYADAMGMTSLTTVTAEQMQNVYDMLDKVVNQHVPTSDGTTTQTTSMAANSATNSFNNVTATPHLTGLALGTKMGCAGGVIGAGAASVGAGFACAATLGIACGAAATGAMAAGLGAGVACDGVIPGDHLASAGTPTESNKPQANAGNTITTTYGGGTTSTTTTDANGNTISSSSTQGSGYGGDAAEDQPSCNNCNMTIHQNGQPDQQVSNSNGKG